MDGIYSCLETAILLQTGTLIMATLVNTHDTKSQPINKLEQLVLNTSLVRHPEFKSSTHSGSRDCAVEVSSTSVTGVTCARSTSANPCRSATLESPMRSISGCGSSSTVNASGKTTCTLSKKHCIKTCIRVIFSRPCWLAKELFRVSDGP